MRFPTSLRSLVVSECVYRDGDVDVDVDVDVDADDVDRDKGIKKRNLEDEERTKAEPTIEIEVWNKNAIREGAAQGGRR
jgi:hypothetical protein